jgi:hypothetical protein
MPEPDFNLLHAQPPRRGRRGPVGSNLRRWLDDNYERVTAERAAGYTAAQLADWLGAAGFRLANGRKPTGPAVTALLSRVERARRPKEFVPAVTPTSGASPFRLTESGKPARSFLTPTRPKGE